MRSSLAAGLIVAIISSEVALAQTAPKLDGAYVGLGTKCEDVFMKTKGGLRFNPKRNAFASAVLIRGKSISTPIATCTLSRVNRKGETLDLTLQCSNDISYAPAKAYLRLTSDGALARLASADDTAGDRYDRCTP